MPIALLTLFSLAVFVSATMISQPDGNYEVTVHLNQGWNLIAGTEPTQGILANSDIGLNDIGAMWYYSPVLKKYYQIYPENELDQLSMEEGRQLDEDIILTSAMWIYSRDSGDIKYSTLEDYPSLENRQLHAGWNLVSVTPEMAADINNLPTVEEKQKYTLNAMKGSCSMQKAYFFDSANQEWLELPLTIKLDNTHIGRGILIKVSSDCTLGTSGSSTSPPGLPGGGENPPLEEISIDAPQQIAGYSLESKNFYVNEECVVYMGKNFCKKGGRIEYINEDSDKAIHIIPTVMTSGAEEYKEALKSVYDLNSENIYESSNEEKEAMWFYQENMLIGVQMYYYTNNPDGSRTASKVEINTDHVVIKYFLDKYPPIAV
ncbi:hypothetical protein CMI37_21075 [Candidatus Pacearchaeota archaeon]|nr:hypothetical protein [Candidatus Pacearchaeota archaeon]